MKLSNTEKNEFDKEEISDIISEKEIIENDHDTAEEAPTITDEEQKHSEKDIDEAKSNVNWDDEELDTFATHIQAGYKETLTKIALSFPLGVELCLKWYEIVLISSNAFI